MKNFITLSLSLISLAILFAGIKGYSGNPTADELNTNKWKVNGPFELSPERGRFALLYSIVEDKSFQFSLPIARFATPDLGIKNEKYVSLFAPGISFLLIPGYLLGHALGYSQVGAFSIISLFAIFNMLLIVSISRKFGAEYFASLLAGFIFLFATPAFSYTTTIYQHHISVFIILLSIRVLASTKLTFWSSSLVWILLFVSIPVDYPNLILSLPIAISLILSYFRVENIDNRTKVTFDYIKSISIIGAAIPLIVTGIFNFHSYGNPFQFASTVGGVQEIGDDGKPTVPKTARIEDAEKYLRPEARQRSAVNFFKTRHQLNSTGILLFSRDRGVVVFTPVILLGIIGFLIINKKKVGAVSLSLLLGITVFNLVLYSMRSDAWGGWAFGNRYFIPAYAILAIGLAIALTRFSRNVLFMFVFLILSFYSLGVNTLGAITTNAIPPKPEAKQLESLTGRNELYSFDRNWEFLKSGKSKSFVYQSFAANYIRAEEYYYILAGLIGLLTTTLTVGVVTANKNENRIGK